MLVHHMPNMTAHFKSTRQNSPLPYTIALSMAAHFFVEVCLTGLQTPSRLHHRQRSFLSHLLLWCAIKCSRTHRITKNTKNYKIKQQHRLSYGYSITYKIVKPVEITTNTFASYRDILYPHLAKFFSFSIFIKISEISRVSCCSLTTFYWLQKSVSKLIV